MTSVDANVSHIPQHIGIIMDGNGRWAHRKRLPRIAGHKEGVQAAKRLILSAIKFNIPYLSLYAFSTENWKRSEDEVSYLMRLVARNLRSEYSFYKKNNIRIYYSGNIEALKINVRKEINKVLQQTKNYSNISVNIALNYGGRDEIIRAMKKCYLTEGETIFLKLQEKDFSSYLDTNIFPEPDLIIRSGKQKRLSNFLLWQSAYTELYFSEVLWPDWTETHFVEALQEYSTRKRQFGAIA